MYSGMLNESQLDAIESTLKASLIDAGVNAVLLIDMAGNTISKQDNGSFDLDMVAFSALAAGNFATVNAMAELIGESEFSLLFHKGKKTSIHFSKVNEAFLLITIFDQETSLGLVRLKVAQTIENINEICA